MIVGLSSTMAIDSVTVQPGLTAVKACSCATRDFFLQKTEIRVLGSTSQSFHNPQIPYSHHPLSINREGRWGTTDDFATSFLHFSLFSTALCDLANSRPVHSLMLSSHLFLCLPCLLPPFTVSCKVFLARPDERET